MMKTNTIIITDNKWKQLKYGYEVPAKVLASDFDYLSEDENHDGFIKYRNRWYHVSNFMNTKHFKNWQGYMSDSYFSGVLIQLSDCGEGYKIATYIS